MSERDQIRAAIPIDVYVGRYVALKKQGKSFSGICPFHQEKTPSFHVYPDTGYFHCYGCQKGGDIFTFVMEREKVPFPEALEILGRFAGIKTDREAVKNPHVEALLDVNRRAMKLFTEFLESPEGQPAKSYISGRSVSKAMIEKFHIGAASTQWQWLTDQFMDKKKELLELGLASQKDDRCFDFFRGRLIFPIHDVRGRIIGFGGRVLPGIDSPAKYINSKESILFHKGSNLYGLHQAASEIRSSGECVVVEGYLDVIGLSQAGSGNVVAPLGTALTEDHLKLLERYTLNLTFLLDGDKAGRAAALKFSRLAGDFPSIRAAVVLLPEGMDPFDASIVLTSADLRDVLHQKISSDRFLLIESLFPGKFLEHLPAKNASGPLEYSRLAKEFYSMERSDRFFQVSMEEKKAALQRLLELIGALKHQTNRDLYQEEGAKILGIQASSLRIDKAQTKNSPAAADTNISEVAEKKRSASGDNFLVQLEREMILEFLLTPAVLGDVMENLQSLEFQDEFSEIVWRFLENRYLTGNIWTPEILQQSDLPAELTSAFTGMLLKRQEAHFHRNFEESKEVVKEFLIDHRLRLLENDLKGIKEEIRIADPIEKEYLYQKQADLLKAKQALSTQKRGAGGSLRQ